MIVPHRVVVRILWVTESKAPSMVPGTLTVNTQYILAIYRICDPSVAQGWQNKLLYGMNVLHTADTQIFESALLNSFTLDSETFIF